MEGRGPESKGQCSSQLFGVGRGMGRLAVQSSPFLDILPAVRLHPSSMLTAAPRTVPTAPLLRSAS